MDLFKLFSFKYNQMLNKYNLSVKGLKLAYYVLFVMSYASQLKCCKKIRIRGQSGVCSCYFLKNSLFFSFLQFKRQ